MASLRRFVLRLINACRPRHPEPDLERELAAHLRLLEEDFQRRGLSPGEARIAATRALGGVAHASQLHRDARSFVWLDELGQDVRHAARLLRRSPGFAAVAILTLALGIGSTTAVFSVVKTVLLDALPYRDADRIVQLLIVTTTSGRVANASVPKFALWREQTNVFDDVAGYNARTPALTLTGGGEPETVRAMAVTAEYFRLFDVPLAVGRGFSADEDRPGGAEVVVIGEGLWTRRYARDPRILGRAIDLAGTPRTVIGIVATDFAMEPYATPDVWIPFQFDLATRDQTHGFQAAARLRNGVTLAMARAQLDIAQEEFRRRFPGATGTGPREGFSADPLRDAIVGGVRPLLLVIASAVGLVLLIACANVANLLLIRTSRRQRELAVRAAIGAGRGRLVRQLVTESAVLFLVGGGAGVGVAFGVIRVLLAAAPATLPRLGEAGQNVTLDSPVVVLALGTSLAAALIFGVTPALTCSRGGWPELERARGSADGGRRHVVVRSCLVVGEVSIAMVLLVGSLLLMRTFVELRRVDPGFRSDDVLVTQLSITGNPTHTTTAVRTLERMAVERRSEMPGMLSTALSNTLGPEARFAMSLSIAGRPAADGRSRPLIGWALVSHEYFDMFRIPLIRGRRFIASDRAESEPVAMINDVLARTFWPDSDPVDDHVVLGEGLGVGPQFPDRSRRIVGVVGNVRDVALSEPPRPLIYVPVGQVSDAILDWNMRLRPFFFFTRPGAAAAAATIDIERLLRRAGPSVAVGSTRSVEAVMARSTLGQRFDMLVLSAFAACALVLSATGIYGVIALAAEQRTREMAIRLCIGARAGDVRRLLLTQGLRLAGAGIVVGTIAALAFARLLQALLYGVTPSDPTALIASAVVLAFVAFGACSIPAWRIGRLNPMKAMRSE